MAMCVQVRVHRQTRVCAIARVCVRPLWAGHHWLPQPPGDRVGRRVCLVCTSPGHPCVWCAPQAVWRAASRAWGLLVLDSQAPGFPLRPAFCFPGSAPPPARRSPGQGPKATPPGPSGQGGLAARRAPPPPGRPDGFFHDCIRPRAAFVPAVPVSWPASPQHARVFPGPNWSMARPPRFPAGA